jgi:hypothetical protein
MSDLLVTDIAQNLGADFLRNVDRELRWQVPAEKLKHYEEAARRAEADRIWEKSRPVVEGLGERKLVIPARTFFRWWQAEPGCWLDKTFNDEMFRDNPELRG